MKNTGFTLIELLAVIVILAIIALIATPIVLSIIDDAKESSMLRSAEMYLNGVENAVMRENMNNGGNFRPSECSITNGNMTCSGTNVEVEVDGEVPSTGSIIFENGKITEVTLNYESGTIVKDNEGKLIYAELEYEIGQEITFNPGDGNRTWNVIDEDETTVTLMLTENLGNTVAWYSSFAENNYGPKDALDYLNSLTTNWNNVDPIESYTYINDLNGNTYQDGYQKLEIKDGKTKLTHKDGTTITEVEGISKARILSKEEVFEISKKVNRNLEEENLRAYIERNLSTANTIFGGNLTTVDEGIALAGQMEPWLANESKYVQTYYAVLGFMSEFGIETTYDIVFPQFIYQNLNSDSVPYGYWTLTPNASYASKSWSVYFGGYVSYRDVFNNYEYGVRPVITVSKSKLKKQ